jgi:hypothetical protein
MMREARRKKIPTLFSTEARGTHPPCRLDSKKIGKGGASSSVAVSVGFVVSGGCCRKNRNNSYDYNCELGAGSSKMPSFARFSRLNRSENPTSPVELSNVT